MTSDPLFFLKEVTLNSTVKQASLHANGTIHPLHFILNVIFVLVILYLTLLLLKLFYKNNSQHHDYLLKEIVLNPSLKILYVKLNKKLYLLAQTNTQLLLLDTLVHQKDILQALTEEESTDGAPQKNPFSWLKHPGKKPKLPPEFSQTLQSIIGNSTELEELNTP